MNRTKKTVRYLFLFIFLLLIGVVFLFTRSDYVSNKLKGMIIPELEAASGKNITIQNISINIMPLFIDVKGLEVFADDGNKIFAVNKVRGYVDILNLLEQNVSIQRLIFKGPQISSSRKQIEEIIENIKNYSEKESDTKFNVKVEVDIIECTDGAVLFSDKKTNSLINVTGLNSEVTIEEEPQIKMSIKNFIVEKDSWPNLTGDLKTSVILKADTIEVKNLDIGSYGSRFKWKGSYSEDKSIFKTDIALLIDSVKRFFRLKQRGDGKISAQGEIRLGKVRSLNDIFVNLKLNGNFYIETLMELLDVNENLEGLVDFKGEIKGQLPNLSGKANARFRKGVLFNVDFDDLTCEVSYHNGTLKFENGVASLYNGEAQVSSMLNLPGPESFTLEVEFNKIDSGAAFKLIGWDPGVPEGKVTGKLSTSGKVFHPVGWFQYSATKRTDKNVLGRILEVKGEYSLRNNVLSLSNLQLNTAESNLSVTGTIDISQETLNLNIQLATNAVADLTLPYYKKITGGGNFTGILNGTFDNPKLSGNVRMSKFSLESYILDSLIATFSYEKNLLSIQNAVFSSLNEEHSVRGDISFPEAKEFFDLTMPVYNLSVSIKNADFGHVLKTLSNDIPAMGKINADIKILGKDKDIEISGNAFIVNSSVYNISFDEASLAILYKNKEFLAKEITITKGNSVLTAEAMLGLDRRFSYNASSEKILIKDLSIDQIPDDVILKLQSEGNGTFENPTITLTAQVIGGSFQDKTLGGGTIEFLIKNKNISLNASLFEKKMILKGKGYLDDLLPWNAQLTLNPGRYDFIISSILKDIPEDLQLDLNGKIDMKGDRENITISATIKHLFLTLFGQTFSNESDLLFSMNNKKISFTSFTVKSGATSFRLKGDLEIGEKYDILLDGSSALAPLKGLSKNIGYLQGDADFVIAIKGKWDNPDVKGGMNLENASFGLRKHPIYISSINGYLTIDENMITLNNLSGEIGGGSVTISGVVYLQAFRFKRFYGDVKLNNITTVVSRNFHISFDGDLLYRGTLDKKTITGDIKIKRAQYREPLKLSSLVIATKTKEIPRAEISVLDKTELNITITGSKNIIIDNNIARAPIRVDMLLRGTLISPVLFGRIESKEGYAYFRNNEFRIISASADFADPYRINPFINLSAETIVEGYKISLNLEGLIENLDFSLTSDPHLDEGDILALLTMGYIADQTQTSKNSLGAGLLTGMAQEVLEDRVKNIIGLDRFYVDSYVSKTTSEVVPRVTVSKRIVGDKLLITYSAPLVTVEEQMFKLEHFVDRNISIIGIWDEYGGIGGDIKFRYEFE